MKPVKAKNGIRPFTLVLFLLLAGAGYVAFKVVNQGASVRSAIAGPETVVSETVSLDEGAAKYYGFSLPTQGKVEVTVAAAPKSVNVYLMDEQDWQAYSKARQKVTGGKFTYRQAPSARSVLNMKQSDLLPAGSWRVVVERPQEALLFGDSTAATLTIVAY
ncbi:hypothetical protein A2cp1_1098 [Anaeromyxobacter dehalogenans 2CP-1]|uniref:Uncharacterized protein n=1 Tax=Anaeromyxobacter dehalogenans (strain ATCC BAA-258 / DSM 21875 / 2CP-1) TaxID=455488 RepID=B8JF90_ANAD2|nr:hypothetical protein A2cp1_1098 [Anaeromyxobacter dehalogenans 2CP-1]